VVFYFAVAAATKASGSETLQLQNGTMRYIFGGNSTSSVYYDISGTVFYGNTSGLVQNFSAGNLTNLTNLNNSILISQFQSLVNYSIEIHFFEIVFNPGESNISYDPAQGIGNGPIPKGVPSVQPTLVTYALTLAFVLGGVFVLILIGIFLKFYCDKQKRDEEKPILELEDQE